MRIGRLLVSLGAGALLLACSSAGEPRPGQSGSEYMPPQPIPPGNPPRSHCPCTSLREQQQLRATVIAVEEFPEVGDLRYRLRVDAVLSPLPGDELAVGDEFGGYFSGALPCAGLQAEPIAPGSDVLAFFRRGLQDGVLCCDQLRCVDDCRREHGEAAQNEPELCDLPCADQTQAACAQHAQEALLHGNVVLLPWGDELVVGESEFGTASIAPADLPALTLDAQACEAAIEDRSDLLLPPQPEQPSAPSAPTAGSAPTPPTPPTPPSPSAAPPVAGSGVPAPPPPGTNPSMEASPPPAHPEEVRVRCAG
jgi:hypothetical protein